MVIKFQNSVQKDPNFWNLNFWILQALPGKGINCSYDEWKNCELSKTHQEKAAGNQSGHCYQNVWKFEG